MEAAAQINPNLAALVDNHRASNRRRFVVLEGGTRSGKTFSALEYLSSLCMEVENTTCRIYREDGTTCKEALIPDWKLVMQARGYWTPRRWNIQDKRYQFENGSVIQFHGTNEITKLHGPNQDVAFFNEVMEISVDAFRQVNQRTRHLVLMDFNPSVSEHWVFDQILTRGEDEVVHIRSTYIDNPHLTQSQIREILSYDPNNPLNVARGTASRYLWDVYGLGRRGRPEGAIFSNWSTTQNWPDPWNCQRYGYGQDFGFTIDPSTLVECALHNDIIYIRSKFYERGLLVGRSPHAPSKPSIEGYYNDLKIDKDAKIYYDSAQPESGEVLRRAGYNMHPAEKGKNSVMHGIAIMQRFPIRIWYQDRDAIREIENYRMLKKPNGMFRDDKPNPNCADHILDAARYWSLRELEQALRDDKPRSRRKAVSLKSPIGWRQ